MMHGWSFLYPLGTRLFYGTATSEYVTWMRTLSRWARREMSWVDELAMRVSHQERRGGADMCRYYFHRRRKDGEATYYLRRQTNDNDTQFQTHHLSPNSHMCPRSPASPNTTRSYRPRATLPLQVYLTAAGKSVERKARILSLDEKRYARYPIRIRVRKEQTTPIQALIPPPQALPPYPPTPAT